ncbi:MAG: hypothetical protein ABSB35_03860 [Bryobacteraceae bacterium]|jgi:hypothetical protein
MKTFVQLKGGETINLAHVVRFIEHADRVEIFLSDGGNRTLTDTSAMNILLNTLKDQTIFTY